ncbi:LysR family transcriptional regulator substrate-binding protein [Paenibacillus sp. CC-CFT747]|nr:LysR family transcriptional regulator substrate-binding protein [Paenibacillus sp. CC-CFT747]
MERSFSELQAGEKKLQALKRLHDGELRIGAGDSVIKHLLLEPLHAYQTRYPGVGIRLSHGRTADIVRRLKDNEIDCGFVHLPVEEAGLDIRPFRTTRDGFVAGDKYREALRHPLTAEEISGYPLLFMSPGSSTRSFVEKWFAEQGCPVRASMELGSVDLLLECARLGFGLAFVTRSFAEEELKEGRLFEVSTAVPIPPRSIGLAMRSGMPLPLAAQRFLEEFMEEPGRSGVGHGAQPME